MTHGHKTLLGAFFGVLIIIAGLGGYFGYVGTVYPYRGSIPECERTLRAAQAQSLIWTALPISWDYDGNPAILLRRPPEFADDYQTISNVSICTEIIVSQGAWFDRTMNVLVGDSVSGIFYYGRYDGKQYTLK
jgi:hypothetical protein